MRSRHRFRRILTAWAIVVVAASPAFATEEQPSDLLPPITPETESRLRGYLEERLVASNRPGLAAAVVRGNEIVFTLALGEARPDVPMSSDTPVFLASVSKSITAMTLASLVDESLVAPDDPVSLHIPELGAAANEITVGDLMHQHTGISVVSGNELWTSPDATLESVLEHVVDELDPSAGFEYSNANYDLLALIVERAAGRPFPDVVRERVFGPLEMNDSFVGPAGDRENVAQGHYRWLGFGYRPLDDLTTSGMAGSAVMYSTAEDLARFLIAQANEGVYLGDRVLSSEAIALLHSARPYEEEPYPDSPVQPGYAGGLQVDASFVPGEVSDELAGLTTLYHGGSSITSNTSIWLMPEVDLGFVILVNGYSVSEDDWISQVAQGAKAILFGQEPFEVVSGTPLLMRWGIPLFLLLFLIQVGLAMATVPAMRRRRAGEGLRKGDFTLIALATVVDLLAVTGTFWLIPSVSEQPLLVTLAIPDLRLIVIGMAVAVVWGFVRNIWLLTSRHHLQAPSAPA